VNIKSIDRIFISLIIAYFPGFFGSVFTTGEITTWYAKLNKPGFSPPNWLFGPVWTTLYTFMGIALFLIWQKGLQNKNVCFAFWFFIIHLFVNFLWSFVFFSSKELFFALLIIILLWSMILTSIILFWKIDKRASLLLVPYLFWVSFATLLNYSVWQLNI